MPGLSIGMARLRDLAHSLTRRLLIHHHGLAVGILSAGVSA